MTEYTSSTLSRINSLFVQNRFQTGFQYQFPFFSCTVYIMYCGFTQPICVIKYFAINIAHNDYCNLKVAHGEHFKAAF